MNWYFIVGYKDVSFNVQQRNNQPTPDLKTAK